MSLFQNNYLSKFASFRGTSRTSHDERRGKLEKLNEYSMSGIAALKVLNRLAEDTWKRGVRGDFVECGVCNGGSAAAIALGLGEERKRVWLYDSFDGVPEPTVKDGEHACGFAGCWKGSEENVQTALSIAGVEPARVVLKKGWFEETFKEPGPEKICFLHIDADWYESVLLGLDTFYDSVEEGGVVLLDDFGHWEGCREAFYDYCNKTGIKPLIERFGHTQAFWIKNRMHNREFRGRSQVY